MIKRTSTSILLLLMGLLTCSMLNAQPLNIAPQFDPYLPGELNERALYALKDNDISSAIILLERAYLLNPNSPDIKANLELVRKIKQEKNPIQVNGEVIYLDALGNTVSPEEALEVPMLWPEPKPESTLKTKP